MTRLWVLIQPSTDGNPVRYLKQKGMEELLQEPSSYGITHFLHEIPSERDSNYWSEGTALLLYAEVVRAEMPQPAEVYTFEQEVEWFPGDILTVQHDLATKDVDVRVIYNNQDIHTVVKAVDPNTVRIGINTYIPSAWDMDLLVAKPVRFTVHVSTIAE